MEMNYNISQKNVLTTFFYSVQVVSDYVETKTAVDDCRHDRLVNNEVVVNLPLATCQADLYMLNSFIFLSVVDHIIIVLIPSPPIYQFSENMQNVTSVRIHVFSFF